MSLSSLRWFVALTTQDASIPELAAKLGTALQEALDKTQREAATQGQPNASKSFRVQIGRLFRRKGTDESLPMIRAWLADDIGAAVTAKGCVLTQAAWAESVQALDLIIEGLAASSAWGLEHTPGARKGFSRTLDARALVTYLLADQDLEYKQKEAIECASELFEVNPDDIRKYTGLEPINKESAARLAYFALVSNGLLDKAERYFDTEALRDFEEEGAEWRLELARLLGSDTDNV